MDSGRNKLLQIIGRIIPNNCVFPCQIIVSFPALLLYVNVNVNFVFFISAKKFREQNFAKRGNHLKITSFVCNEPKIK